MNLATVTFRKLAFMVIEESMKGSDGTFWNDLGGHLPNDMIPEDAIMDMIEIHQLLTGLCLRRMAYEYPADELDVEGRVAIGTLGEQLLAGIEKNI